jgi:hypothetical protein
MVFSELVLSRACSVLLQTSKSRCPVHVWQSDAGLVSAWLLKREKKGRSGERKLRGFWFADDLRAQVSSCIQVKGPCEIGGDEVQLRVLRIRCFEGSCKGLQTNIRFE